MIVCFVNRKYELLAIKKKEKKRQRNFIIFRTQKIMKSINKYPLASDYEILMSIYAIMFYIISYLCFV